MGKIIQKLELKELGEVLGRYRGNILCEAIVRIPELEKEIERLKDLLKPGCGDER